MKRRIEHTWMAKAGEVEPEPLDPRTQPQLSRYASVDRADNGRLKIDVGGRIVSFDEESGARVSALLALADGQRTLRDLAAATDEPLDDVSQAVQQLYELGIVVHQGQAPVPALTFGRHLDNYIKSMQVRMAADVPSLLEQLEKQPSARLLLGHLVENYHFVHAAASHIAPAVQRAPSEHLQMMFSEYLAGEYWHGLWLRQGLAAGGISEADIAAADPLPGTLAMNNLLRWAATTDLLAYSACLGAGEQEGGQKPLERARRYHDQLRAFKLVPDAAIEPFQLHVEEDVGADHHSFAAEAFAESPPLTRAQQDNIRRTVLSYQRAVGEQHLQILRFYGQADGPPVYRLE